MFKLFKKKSRIETLEKKYEKLLQQSHKMMAYNRRESDRLQAEANEVFMQLNSIKVER
jgi:hypothetical protein